MLTHFKWPSTLSTTIVQHVSTFDHTLWLQHRPKTLTQCQLMLQICPQTGFNLQDAL